MDHVNTVAGTVEDSDSNTASDSDDATVTFTDVAPSIVVTKTAAPTSLNEPGGAVTFTIDVENTSFEEVTVTSFADDRFGDLLDVDANLTGGATATSCNDGLPISIAAGATFTCTIDATLSGNAGDSHVNVVSVTAEDDDGTDVTDSDDATVTFADVAPSIVVTKTAAPTSLNEPGGAVTFTVDVENTSAEQITVTSFSDDRFGDLLDVDASLTGGATATSCNDSLPITIAAGATFTCTIDAALTGNAGDTHTNVVSVTAEDDDGTDVTDSDDATVTFTDVLPTIDVTKTATPTSVPETGATVAFDVVVANTSPRTSN